MPVDQKNGKIIIQMIGSLGLAHHCQQVNNWYIHLEGQGTQSLYTVAERKKIHLRTESLSYICESEKQVNNLITQKATILGH